MRPLLWLAAAWGSLLIAVAAFVSFDWWRAMRRIKAREV